MVACLPCLAYYRQDPWSHPTHLTVVFYSVSWSSTGLSLSACETSLGPPSLAGNDCLLLLFVIFHPVVYLQGQFLFPCGLSVSLQEAFDERGSQTLEVQVVWSLLGGWKSLYRSHTDFSSGMYLYRYINCPLILICIIISE